MDFGPEIKVDGKRPEWLDPDQQIAIHDFRKEAEGLGQDGTGWYGMDENGFKYYGREISPDEDMIRLPADHPHYNLITHTYTVRPEDEAALLASDPLSRSTPDERAVPPELVARLVELSRSVATSPACTIAHTVEAQNIVAALEPVDPDEAEVLALYEGWSSNCDEDVRSLVARTLARGRQLEKEGK